MQVPQNVEERFLAKVDKSGANGCWNWTAAGRGNGYGTIKIDGKARDAHRVAHEMWIGEIPKGMVVMHKCDNRSCVNPEHLQLGSYRDNHTDAIAKGLITPFKKTRTEPLTEEEIRQLVADFKGGVSRRTLSTKYKVADTSLTRLLKNIE